MEYIVLSFEWHMTIFFSVHHCVCRAQRIFVCFVALVLALVKPVLKQGTP